MLSYLLFPILLLADTHYVDINCATPVSPYTNWTTAANVIQDAVDAATTGDTVLVADGVYGNGGRAVYGTMTNRVAIDRPIEVRSVNGPGVTAIKGRGPLGDTAVRCVYVGANAMLSGFLLTNGGTRTSGDVYKEQSGGGAKCETSGLISNCVIMGNSATCQGGGTDWGVLKNCRLSGNSATYGGGEANGVLNNCILSGNTASQHGGGADASTLNNCTVSGNSASTFAGGTYASTLKNCIIYYNTASDGLNYYNGTLDYCCTTPAPGGTGNITNEPYLTSASHIAADSSCVGKGSAAYASGLDTDGEAWRSPPSIGADEPYANSAGELSVAIEAAFTRVTVGFQTPFSALIQGPVVRSAWDFGDGSSVTNRAYASHTWAATGSYAVVLTAWNADHPAGVACTAMVSVAPGGYSLVDTHYVDINCATPQAPYTNWATAATVIQDAVDATTAGDTVLVADGVYSNGGWAAYGNMIDRVAITEAITVQSVNGPSVTIVVGKGPVGDGAMRCAYVANGAVLAGFTLTNGATHASGNWDWERSGGGVWCGVGGLVSNCWIVGNSASFGGGGAYWGTLNNCILSGNSASDHGGGAGESTLNNCTLSRNSANRGGGACWCKLNNCTLSANSAIGGGGSAYGTLKNCMLVGNSAVEGGGAYLGTLNNCTLVGNSASVTEGGAYQGTLNNCIIYYNTAPVSPNWSDNGILRYCCTTPEPGGTGNITNEPCLVSLSHIAAYSPCVGKGSAAYVSGVDMDGEAWLSPPSIGVDEPYAASATGELSVAIGVDTTVTVGCQAPFTALIEGHVTESAWDFGDGSRLTNQAYARHAWATTGSYAVVLTAWNADHPSGVSCTTVVSVVDEQVYYVNVSNTTPARPYTSWETAATNIQEAISAAGPPGRRLVLVMDGVYEVGGTVMYGAMTNRISLTNAVTVRSVNGPAVTIIRGTGPLGDGAVRCAYVGANCVLAGVTLTSGATRTNGDDRTERSGGGVWCEVGGVVSNCWIVGNSASYWGGGAYWGTLNNCTLSGNTASQHGGAVFYSTLNNCILSGNSANYGGGASESTLYNCTLTGNSASMGGGTYVCTLINCIVYYNTAHPWYGPNNYVSTLSYCCTIPAPGGTGNITDLPFFRNVAGGDYRLQAFSTAIDAGQNADWMFAGVDLDGKPRILNGRVDMGAYETPFTSNLRVLLQGPYDTNRHAMVTRLQDTNAIPLTSPYAAAKLTAPQIPSNVTDWVLLELKDTNGIARVSQSAFLARDGAMLSADGAMGVVTEVSPGDRLYLTVKHRNHLAAMSAQPLIFTNILTTYDFTVSCNQYFGGTNACVELEPGIWGLISGDADGDGKITPVDRAIVSNQVGKTGYLQGDLNLDGKVDGGDE